jgi:hypothetical protein
MSEEKTVEQEFVLKEEDYEKFYSLVQLLTDNFYDVRISHTEYEDGEYGYECTSLSTGRRNSLRYAFSTPNSHVYSSLSGGIAVDHVDCFDKWAKCPLKVPLPSNEEEERLLLSYMEWLRGIEGYEKSKSYDFDFYVQSYEQIKKLLTKKEEG